MGSTMTNDTLIGRRPLWRGVRWLLWAGLMLATVMTWRLGEGSGGLLLAAIVLGIAFVKGAVVALEFMALRHAPALWRNLSVGWLVLVCTLVGIAYWKGLA